MRGLIYPEIVMGQNQRVVQINCSYSNKTFGTKYNCEHVTMDSEMCVILKNKIKKVMDTTDYTIKPLFPRFLGKIDTLKIVEPNGSK